MTIEDFLRRLPKVDQLLEHAEWRKLTEQFGRRQVIQWTRAALEELRRRIREGELRESAADLLHETLLVLRRHAEAEQAAAMQRVINATGVILHTNLGRAPLAAAAVARLQEVSGATNIELDLVTGRRGSRGARVRRLLAELTGAEDAVVVNNCAAATLLTLHVVAHGREVVIARGQLVEIGGKFRLPDVFVSAGAELREVGTTNRTYLEDYQRAIGERTAAVMRVHRSNFAQVGFVTEPGIAELRAHLELPPDVPLIDDCGSGLVHRLPDLLPGEPVIQDSVAAGADLVLFSGDKLFGGPQAGIIVGRRKWTERLLGHPWMRTLRTDKLTLAALEATLELHMDGALDEIPVYRMLLSSEEHLQRRARKLELSVATRLPPEYDGPAELKIVATEAAIGGGAAPGQCLPSRALAIRTDCPDRYAQLLRTGRPAIVPRCEEGQVLLDVRTIDEHEIELVAERIVASLLQLHPRENL